MMMYGALQHGYDGIMCEHDVNECFSGPCNNGGTCINKEAMFHCACRSGFTGNVSRLGKRDYSQGDWVCLHHTLHSIVEM